nr:reverse transcriptase domain, reverse transcriptase zinc-binding domain protein [Tanacetum cinerariifolium]
MANNSICALGSFPLTYLGLPIGSIMSIISNWKSLLDRFHSRLSSWKANYLSIGGRLTLIKAELGSLRIYFLSIFKVPKCVLNSLERICAMFLREYLRSWIKWSNVLSSFKKGRLNIGSLKYFNLDLLQKWRWRMYSCPKSVWDKVIKALHGQEGVSVNKVATLMDVARVSAFRKIYGLVIPRFTFVTTDSTA